MFVHGYPPGGSRDWTGFRRLEGGLSWKEISLLGRCAASRKPLQPRPVDVNELVQNLEKMLGRLMREDIRIHTVLDPKAKPLLADPSQLEQVIMNLAVNARHMMR